MTRTQREALIGTYLRGEMSAVEEQDFFIQVALDDELRAELRAQRTVDSAMRKERDSMTTTHSGLRQRVMSSLGVPLSGGVSGAELGAIMRSGAAAASFSLRRMLHGLLLSGGLGIAVAVGIVIGIPSLAPSSQTATDRRSAPADVDAEVGPQLPASGQPTSDPHPGHDAPAESVPESHADRASTLENDVEPDRRGVDNAVTNSPTSVDAQPRGTSSTVERSTANRSSTRAPSATAPSAAQSDVAPPAKPTATQQEDDAPAQHERVRSDGHKVGVTVTVDPPEPKK